MPAPPGKIGTRASNANKHPGIPDQRSNRRSVAEMATIRAAEKAHKNRKDTSERVAPLVIAGIEDLMANADRDDDENAARPIPANIPRVFRPGRRTYAVDSLEQWQAGVNDDDDDDEHRGLSWFFFRCISSLTTIN
jgi:hypothetical protein